MSISSLQRKITFHHIVIVLAMMAILGLISYYSILPPTQWTIMDNQTGSDLVMLTTWDTLTSSVTMTGMNTNTGTFTIYPSKYFVDTHEDDGSCMAVRIEDDKGKPIDVPAEINEALHCIGWSESLSHNYRFLLYSQSISPDYKTIDLKTYDFSNRRIQTLMSFNNTIDGMSCQRREDDSYIACVVINQKEYAWSTKIFILQINADGWLVKKQVFPQTNDTRVGFHCASNCYPSDFRWEWTRTLQYEWQDNGDDILTGKTYSIKYE